MLGLQLPDDRPHLIDPIHRTADNNKARPDDAEQQQDTIQCTRATWSHDS